ncbi:hypothetical protein TWF281_011495 [Arthrobotrys megalospora]
MSLPVPTEILLDILSRIDRETLCNVRIVSKQLCRVSTEVLFHRLNIHYGFDRSIAQMRAIIDAPTPVSSIPIRQCIKNLFLPSESFFPHAHHFEFSHPAIFKWSYELPKDHPILKGEHHTLSDSTAQRAVRSGELAEDPSDLEVRFDLGVKKFMDQFDLYSETIVEFLKACENIQKICIAIGIGWGSQRMKYWTLMTTSNALPVIASQIREMSVLMPRVRCAYIPIVSEYLYSTPVEGQQRVFSSLTSLKITIHSTEKSRIPVDKERIVKKQIGSFLSNAPNINSYRIANSGLHGSPGPLIFSQFSERMKLSSLTLSTIFFTALDKGPVLEDRIVSAFKDFQAMIISLPSLTNLKMEGIIIHHVNTGRIAQGTFDPRSSLPMPTPEKLPSHIFEELPPMNWTEVLVLLRNSLPKLTSYSFGHLMYGRHRRNEVTRWKMKVMLIVPMDGKYEAVKFKGFFKETRGDELISPYRKDHLELETFKREINRRRGNIGLGSGGSSNLYPFKEEEAGDTGHIVGQQENLMWRFL